MGGAWKTNNTGNKIRRLTTHVAGAGGTRPSGCSIVAAAPAPPIVALAPSGVACSQGASILEWHLGQVARKPRRRSRHLHHQLPSPQRTTHGAVVLSTHPTHSPLYHMAPQHRDSRRHSSMLQRMRSPRTGLRHRQRSRAHSPALHRPNQVVAHARFLHFQHHNRVCPPRSYR